MSANELLTPAEYAELRRCSLRTLDRERANNTGCPYVRLGGRVFYRRGDIEIFIETCVNRPNDEQCALLANGTPSAIENTRRVA